MKTINDPKFIFGFAVGLVFIVTIVIPILQKPKEKRKAFLRLVFGQVLLPLILFICILPFVVIGFIAHYIKVGIERGWDHYDDFTDWCNPKINKPEL